MEVMQPFRLRVGALKGPHLFDIVEVIGKKKKREFKKAIATL
jgi:glutamyl-tRNA synthetase